MLSQAPLKHDHIQFGHCYKGQENWDSYLSRFARGGGVLYDIEFLTDPSGKRVAAFGYYAGFAGAAIALLAWAHQLTNPKTPLPSVIPSDYPSQSDLEKAIKDALSRAIPLKASQPPRVIVIGALGRCGTGAVDCCLAAGVPVSSIMKWDMAETVPGGPFSEIATSDVSILASRSLHSSQPNRCQSPAANFASLATSAATPATPLTRSRSTMSTVPSSSLHFPST